MFKCEICGREHDGSYGSGRFCSLHCRKVFIGKQVKHNHNRTYGPFNGKHHTEKSKNKLRLKYAEYAKTHFKSACNYNKSSIEFFDELSKKNNWNLQHTENGGEFYTGIGYFVDAYDKDLNIVVEYDEKAHYKDVQNNVLKDDDVKRQKRNN